MKHYPYTHTLMELWTQACGLYESGNQDHATYFSEHERDFIHSIGLHSQEIFDYVEDYVDRGEPDFGTFLIIHDIRRRYFIEVQRQTPSKARVTPDALPARDAELGGIPWLPRILAKARAKLRGELDPNIMYACGGDRAFLKAYDIHPGELLHAVWKHAGDNQPILEWIQARQG